MKYGGKEGEELFSNLSPLTSKKLSLRNLNKIIINTYITASQRRERTTNHACMTSVLNSP